ncbi:hypothetical protein PL321_11085 [Caloramator sp. mosi_1]|uniref:hypothetical protein n=1 Tax=Caloramator sp. mosi_1 TaxID=3023090 RepID=UPI002362CD46|nr:hypothetical protein [Caloramator sp. mosi_1]WDC83313.1 hypothetical protein PL321_11085 [Caloramator sp. mosi_1]
MPRRAKEKYKNDAKDCFAYRNKRCTVLTSTDCVGCKFYKTREQYKLDIAKAMDRLNSLDKEFKSYFMEKYYLHKGMK